MARGGKLAINIDDVKLVSGEKAALRAVKDAKGGGHTGAMVGGMVATGVLFFPAAPFFLFMHGHAITLPKGTETTAYINGNARLDYRNFVPGATQAAAPPVDNSSAPAAQKVTRPDEADSTSSDWKEKYWPNPKTKQEEKKTPPK